MGRNYRIISVVIFLFQSYASIGQQEYYNSTKNISTLHILNNSFTLQIPNKFSKSNSINFYSNTKIYDTVLSYNRNVISIRVYEMTNNTYSLNDTTKTFDLLNAYFEGLKKFDTTLRYEQKDIGNTTVGMLIKANKKNFTSNNGIVSGFITFKLKNFMRCEIEYKLEKKEYEAGLDKLIFESIVFPN